MNRIAPFPGSLSSPSSRNTPAHIPFPPVGQGKIWPRRMEKRRAGSSGNDQLEAFLISASGMGCRRHCFSFAAVVFFSSFGAGDGGGGVKAGPDVRYPSIFFLKPSSEAKRIKRNIIESITTRFVALA